MAGEPQADCLFCKIVAGEIPATVVRETETTVAFRDINPQAPTHVLVIPRVHYRDAAALAAAEPRDRRRRAAGGRRGRRRGEARTRLPHRLQHRQRRRPDRLPRARPCARAAAASSGLPDSGAGSAVSVRELVVLGTASQVPTRHRNHNGYLLRWDGEGILFDPGEGTQRQMLRAGVAAHDLNRICVTHFHGDHSLGLAGVIQRINLDRVPHPVTAHYPARGQRFFDRLRYATAYRETVDARARRRSPRTASLAARRRRTRWTPAGSRTPSSRTATGSSSPTGAGCCPSCSPSTASPGPDVGPAPAGGRAAAGSRSTRSARCGAGSGSRSSWTPGSATGCTRSPRAATCSSSSRRSSTRTTNSPPTTAT